MINNLEKIVYNFRNKYEEGFTSEEMSRLCKELKVDKDQFNEALGINTCVLIEGETITYHRDVLNALNKILNGNFIFWD